MDQMKENPLKSLDKNIRKSAKTFKFQAYQLLLIRGVFENDAEYGVYLNFV